MIRILVKLLCRQLSRLKINDLSFKSNDYEISFSNLNDVDKYWQYIHVDLIYKDGNGVAYYPKRTNPFLIFKQYYSGFYEIKEGSQTQYKASKEMIRKFKKAILWFPFITK